MASISQSLFRSRNPSAWPAVGIALVFPTLALIAPKMTVAVFAVAGIAGLSLNRQFFGRIDYGSTIPFALLILWAAVSLLWTPDPQDATSKFLRFVVCCLLLLTLPVLVRVEAKGAMVASMVLALGLLVYESVSQNSWAWFLYGPPEDTPPGAAAHAVGWRLNRGISVVAFAVWGVSLVFRRRWVFIALPIVLTTFFSLFDNLSAVVGLAAGTIGATAAIIHRQLGRVAVAVAITIALLGVPLMVWSGMMTSAQTPTLEERIAGTSNSPDVLTSVQAAASNSLRETDPARVGIWHLVTDRFLEKPVSGWGFRASRAMSGTVHNGHQVPMAHPHNAGLEIGMELGLVGLLPVAIFLGILERRISALDDASRITATGLLVTTLSVLTTAYSIWQAQALVSLAFGYVAWKIGVLSLRSTDAPTTFGLRFRP